MTRAWKPGDVALVTWNEGAEPEILFRYLAGNDFDRPEWQSAEDGEAYPRPDQLRPLVVIDPEDREQVERLVAAWRSAEFGAPPLDNDQPMTVHQLRMRHALRSLIAPPKPPEPTGLGAVVEDAAKCRWIKIDVHHECNDWTPLGAPERDDPGQATGRSVRWSYADIAAVRILSEGVDQ